METRELLTSLLSGDKFTSADLDVLINENVEDQYLEYKRGDILDKKNNPAAKVREYVSAFANSEGGILVIGVGEPEEGKYVIDGCKAPGGKSLQSWAANAISDIAQFLIPLPRFFEIKHNLGKVLIIATSRTQVLVPCIVNNKVVYFIRLHDETKSCPDFLISDLVLHNRARPLIEISGIELYGFESQYVENNFLFSVAFSFRIKVENHSLSWADGITIGHLAYRPIRPPVIEHPNNQLLSYIDSKLDDQLSSLYELSNQSKQVELHDFPPFAETDLYFPMITTLYPQHKTIDNLTFRTALLVLARESSPLWYQFDIHINSSMLIRTGIANRYGQIIEPRKTVKSFGSYRNEFSSDLNLSLVSGIRPVVSIIQDGV